MNEYTMYNNEEMHCYHLPLLSMKAVICVQLKIHQSNRQHKSFVCNRDLISTKNEQQ